MATGLDQRHLLVVVSRHAGPVFVAVEQALTQGFLPTRRPEVNGAFTGVWIAFDEQVPAAYWANDSGWCSVLPTE